MKTPKIIYKIRTKKAILIALHFEKIGMTIKSNILRYISGTMKKNNIGIIFHSYLHARINKIQLTRLKVGIKEL